MMNELSKSIAGKFKEAKFSCSTVISDSILTHINMNADEMMKLITDSMATKMSREIIDKKRCDIHQTTDPGSFDVQVRITSFVFTPSELEKLIMAAYQAGIDSKGVDDESV